MSASGVLEVLVLGDSARLHGVIPGTRALDPATVSTRFDSDTDTWTVTTGSGEQLIARTLISTAESTDAVVARHGVPNRFQLPGPHTRRQARYVARLIDNLRRSGASRIESRAPRLRVHPFLPTRGISRFYLTGSVAVEDEIYDGPAVLIHRDEDYPSRVRLTGHFDPIDGQYHWQGMFFADLPGTGVTGSQVSIRIGEHTASGRVAERTPWGSLTVIGAAGYPPYPLEDPEEVRIALPPRS
ncbi:DUF4873 domain-containing protein [Mycolicibacter minnesotensis]|uniref:DUF4873 domain-containing protein n=1 Tax=Mycolicibacter minnesotensis TaxID=1118379 RepID=A0A7I7R723_9MYCO|nr:DUF4873 domain-containing protein [Mycolicibacter minnesotensis]ORB00860.1 DUF4873 domain-containing protein [Mycolicibacter minnesotensis]BBY34449.1 hypothetical protein MMIN_25100 [Mycolicibacter minnesotensis]